MEQDKNEVPPETLTCLRAVLSEAEQNIRAYDTKAQIMGVGFIFSVTMISVVLEKLPIERSYDLLYLIGGFIVLMGPVALFGAVLYPTRRTAPVIDSDRSGVTRCMYFTSEDGRDAARYSRDVAGADWAREIVYEITRVSALRDLKRRRFIRAMMASAASFAMILLASGIKLAGLG